VLVHLVRGGLDQGQPSRARREKHGRLQHHRMRRTHGVDTRRVAGFMTANKIHHRIHVGCSTSFSSGSIASSAAARKASTTATTVTVFGTMPNTIIETIAVIIGAPAFASGATTSARP